MTQDQITLKDGTIICMPHYAMAHWLWTNDEWVRID